MIIPSIDLMNGKAVQLKQGREKVLEREDVIELAKYYSRFGEIAVIDLDCALGNGNNEELIKQICKIAPCRVGGGIRTEEKAKRLIAYGAKKIIIGTAASQEFLAKLPKDKVIVAIDTKNGKITTTNFNQSNGKIPSNIVEKVFIDAQKNTWILTHSGISSVDRTGKINQYISANNQIQILRIGIQQ